MDGVRGYFLWLSFGTSPAAYITVAFVTFRSHWIVLPESLVPGRPLPLTFNFYNTTKDIEVQVDLIQDTHTLISTATHTFVNGKLSEDIEVQVDLIQDTHTLISTVTTRLPMVCRFSYIFQPK